ncbi:hypothetical protein Mro03_69880 [Microbispora rosea subsp. rosea]|nr:hypothetical protein Mro03_69880 [Microbispora rosea subsp. rosea]
MIVTPNTVVITCAGWWKRATTAQNTFMRSPTTRASRARRRPYFPAHRGLP